MTKEAPQARVFKYGWIVLWIITPKDARNSQKIVFSKCYSIILVRSFSPEYYTDFYTYATFHSDMRATRFLLLLLLIFSLT